ncbi:hypothetical protein ANCDUO_18861 [Ancylostoma duodenale]|uniref:Uncharacterized protein n=1 Tax=Ancylostoma duodenale TaxID=51022 RepID=A0A0C2CMR9_9BILA|nr:hypothetical protein ANCDUO_18861 [Ancylostoma duodenale]
MMAYHCGNSSIIECLLSENRELRRQPQEMWNVLNVLLIVLCQLFL